jgi:hypothetical protein
VSDILFLAPDPKFELCTAVPMEVICQTNKSIEKTVTQMTSLFWYLLRSFGMNFFCALTSLPSACAELQAFFYILMGIEADSVGFYL